ncbi:MAG: polyribonucleotide nucleotidyltransferase [Anaerolineae bacterium]|jgi:polyribonucleotide nucleotidyltransferase
MNTHTFTVPLGDHTITMETGKLAHQAGGALTLRCGDTMLMTTATMSSSEREGISFFPLTVDFEERLYAAGRIPGSFFRREGRPTESAILIARLTDRPLRPLFPDDLRNEVQIIVTPLSQDETYRADTLAVISASAALTISDVPFGGPIGAVRVGYIDGELVVNPTIPQMEESLLDLRLAGTKSALLMVEAGAEEIPEDVILEALSLGHEAIQAIIDVQQEMRQVVGKPKRDYTAHGVPEELVAQVRGLVQDRMAGELFQTSDKKSRYGLLDELRAEAVEKLGEEYDASQIKEAFSKVESDVVRRRVIDQGIRVDGRRTAEIRPLSAEVGLLPRAHGSGLFNRGETQVLSVATLGTPREEQMLDDLSPDETKKYIHHYNFPPYSTGETWFLRGPKRREIGHGALAERALEPVLPPDEEFPYTIRVVSEALSSDGSTSMASVCGSSLSLMDAGVPLRKAVGGIAMGLVMQDGQYRVLTDILGMEDHLGDMDFKVAGTKDGITALQMDIKVEGISKEIMAEAMEQARQARLQVLDAMADAIPEPRPQLAEHAPQMLIISVNPDKLGAVIGSGGKTVRAIQEEYDVKVDIEDDGTIYIAADNRTAAEQAIEKIERLTEEPEIGKIYTGRVVRTTDFGAFVEIIPGTDGMVHISQLSDHKVPSVQDVVNVNDEIMVMVTDIGPDGKIRLSRRAVLMGWTPEEARENDRPIRGGRRRPPRRR